MYKLKDLDIPGRYFANGKTFKTKKEIELLLREYLSIDSEEDFSKLPLWELLEISGFDIEEVK
jgi:hypothetical protein